MPSSATDAIQVVQLDDAQVKQLVEQMQKPTEKPQEVVLTDKQLKQVLDAINGSSDSVAALSEEVAADDVPAAVLTDEQSAYLQVAAFSSLFIVLALFMSLGFIVFNRLLEHFRGRT